MHAYLTRERLSGSSKNKELSLEPTWLTFVVVHLLSLVRLSVISWTAVRQASLSFAVSWSLLKFMSIESMMPSTHQKYLPGRGQINS